MSKSSVARVFLGLDAALCATAGAVLLLIPDLVAQIMFVEPGGWKPVMLRILGVGLLILALDLAIMAANRHVAKRDVMLIVVADVGWILGSALVIILAGDSFTPQGVLMVDIAAIVVAVFAVGQFFGARKIVPPLSQAQVRPGDGGLIASVKRVVNAPAPTVWEIMTDHPGYADVASNLSKVEVLSGDGFGMKRRCFGPKGENWIETCNLFEEGRVFGFRIHTEAPDYPYPISDLEGRWAVEPSGCGSEFSINIAAKPKGGFIARYVFSLLARRQFKTVLIDLADAWAERMERETPEQTTTEKLQRQPAAEMSQAIGRYP